MNKLALDDTASDEEQQAEPDEDEDDDSIIEPKKKRFRSKYKFVKEFDNKIDIDTFLRSNNECAIVINHSDPVNCTLCEDSDHNMKASYFNCDKCTLKLVLI
jgi:hypothetical protein